MSNTQTLKANVEEGDIETKATATSHNPTPRVENATNNEGQKQAPARKRKKQRSEAWKHFTRMPLEQTKGKHRAKCNYCGMDYASHPSNHGTKALWRHFEKCPKNPNKANKMTQSLFSVTCSQTMSTQLFNQERCRKDLAKFIVKDEMPFRVVEGEGFKELLHGLEPRFQIPSRWTVARDCYKLYLEEARHLKKYFKKFKVRVSLTTDCWTSIQNANYMCLTAHWVDENWTLQKRILNFSVIENHKGDTIGKEIEGCLFSWGIDKVFTITVDNASSNDTAIAYLKKRLREWNGLICDGEYMHMRCAAHILNLIVSEGLKEMNKSIELIRHAIKFVRSSPARLRRFKELMGKQRIDSKSLLSMDCPTRWNSTYLMLENAVKFIKVFDRMEEEDEDYNEYFKKKVEEEPPSPYDWGVAKEFIVFLKLFYSMTLKFSASNFVTSNTCFQQIVAMQTKLKTSATNSNALLGDMVRRMQSKLDKYWGKADSMNPLLVIAVILDPRYKFKYVQVALENMYSEPIQRELVTKNIMDVLYSLYGEYSKDVFDSEASQSQARAEHGDDNVGENQDSIPDDDVLAVMDDETMRQFYTIASIERQEEKNSEVDEYLHAELVASRDPKFDVLAWWKVNAFKYKVLSLIARDVLASPVSTVSSESAFSTGGRVLDTFRSSLSAKMVEALICAQSWLSQPTFKLKELDVDNFDESDNLIIEEESGAQRSTISSDSEDDDDDDDDPMQD